MSQYLFEENIKKTRKKALMMTVLFHVVLISGIWYSTLGEESSLKANMNEWMTNFTGDETAEKEYNVRP